MLPRSNPLLYAALTAVVVVGTWLTFTLVHDAADGELAPKQPPPSESRPVDPTHDLREDKTSYDDAVTTSARSAVAETASDDVPVREKIWIEGRVVLPAETPGDEKVSIIAEEIGARRRDCGRSDVATDGGFRVSFPDDAKLCRLRIDARYLYLAHDFTLNPKAHGTDVVLRPELGGILHAHFVLPVNEVARRAEMVGKRIDLWSTTKHAPVELPKAPGELTSEKNDRMSTARLQDSRTFHETGKLAPDLAVEFCCLPAGLVYQIDGSSGPIWNARRNKIEIRAGQITDVDVDLLLGVSIRGRIVDDLGAPVWAARIDASVKTRDGAGQPVTSGAGYFARSLRDGSFSCRGIAPGDIALTATREGRVSALWSAGEHTEGDDIDSVVIVLPRGNRITGRVRWPADQTSRQCTVVARRHSDEGPDHARDDSLYGHAPVRSDGTFEMSGLGSVPVDLSVDIDYQTFEPDDPPFIAEELQHGLARDSGGEPRKIRWRRKYKMTWTRLSALAESVEPGSTNVLLALRPTNVSRPVVGDR